MNKQPVLNPWGLTPREVQAMDALCSYGLMKTAAFRLGVSGTTFNDYTKSVHKKIGCHNRVVACLKFDRWRQGEGKGVPA